MTEDQEDRRETWVMQDYLDKKGKPEIQDRMD